MSDNKPTQDVYEIITSLVIAQLEQGVVPWEQPWTSAGPPRNLISGKAYRGINWWMLASMHYELNYFLSFNQVKDLGGKVRKGEKSNIVVFWKPFEKEVDGKKEKTYVLRYYSVFNVAQCDGLPSDKVPIVEERDNDPIATCDEIIAAMPLCPAIQSKSQQAYYDSVKDCINMPKLKSFIDSANYYHVLFHELIHSTGHERRLNRKEITQKIKWASMDYSIEELTAEIGSCYLQSFSGIAKEPTENSMAYIHNWLEQLKGDKRFIIRASSQAQKATDYILNISYDTAVNSEEQIEGQAIVA